jgi:transcriptional regulator with XRE-family HTH domain
MSGYLELKALIIKKGFRQNEFARKIGMHKGTLSLILNQKIDPKISQVEMICNELGIDNPRQYFFDYKFNNSKQNIAKVQ